VTREEAIGRLLKHEAELKRLGVEKLYLFGSTARGEAASVAARSEGFRYD
jgi:predicted nucleotidyltransferase